ncbi:MAG: DUF1501 domain-containing protein, partial [Isosphaeraceae bacterium]
MITRRQLLTRALRGSSLLAFGTAVPQFVARAAGAAKPGADNVLVVLELTGGNDGLNTVIPYADDLYHKARPTLRQTDRQVIRLDDHVGLNSAMRGLRPLWDQGHLAVVQGVGYPNPQRSHFESMDIWQTADPRGAAVASGWLGRAATVADDRSDGVPILHLGEGRPLAVEGAPAGGAVSVGDQSSFRLAMDGPDNEQQARRRLLADLTGPSGDENEKDDGLASFVRRRQVQTLSAVETMREVLEGPGAVRSFGDGLTRKLQLVAGLIARDFGTRLFYVSLGSFDTHASQGQLQGALLAELANSVAGFFQALKTTGHDRRVRLMTFSEFGRRVRENGSRGTDHGAASCLFVAGPSVKGGVIGKHPSLSDLDDDDLRYHTDFRRVYATVLDGWLGCDSKA